MTELARQVFVRRTGSGPRVLALHSSASTSGQWWALTQLLASHFEVVAPDHAGHGGTPAWRGNEGADIRHHAALFEPLLGDQPAHLIGHSFGGVVAMQIALAHPDRVRSLTLYEPVLAAVLSGRASQRLAREKFRAVARQVRQQLDQGSPRAAAQVFVDYWGGSGSWQAMNPSAQDALLSRMAVVPQHFAAIEQAHLIAWRLPEIRCPVLLLEGSQTTAAARQIAGLLALSIPNVRHEPVAGAGHMGPLTHAAAVNQSIAAFLLGQQAPLRARSGELATA